MKYIVSGSLAFVFLYLFDVYTLKNKVIRRRIFGILGLATLIYSAIMATVVSEKIYLPLAIRIIGGLLLVVAIFLLVYSLFLELPFSKTYGEKEHSNKLVDTGTYALCRHPGVLWFGFIFLFFFLTTGAKLLVPAGIIWTLLDVIHVYIQEKQFFPKMFPQYKDYIKKTPMLIPTQDSIKKCKATL
ncbi:methyltransferase [Alkaliphilus hydrothermalis]|uniref:Protein-S-isoprenylcysteine O-methyltransferase Ste14 n=1 Tax=Alkaliphilus hydrothermalis TaxID=1482730 RepID=A0ABS2NR97_9FIRM|nr:methyltransferase [Alkaliphilus hydrothermalis]MBM7615485.1 protein-S-isoprenylcysteine O-methyltransferase Ste14 [Alkaliphilus hydrothermalis]